MVAHVRTGGVVFLLGLSACGREPVQAVAETAPAIASPPPSRSGGAELPAASSRARPRAVAPAPRGHLSGRAVGVVAIDGDVVVRDERGREARLTTEGRDDSPALSPDGKTVVFRRHATRAREGPLSLQLIGVSDGEPELLVAEDASDSSAGLPLVDLGAPEFSLDGRRIYFSVQNGRLGALFGVDRATKKASWILTAVATEQIRRGPYRGHFFALRREQTAPDGPYQDVCYVLHSVTGDKLRAVQCNGDYPHDLGSIQDPAARKELGI